MERKRDACSERDSAKKVSITFNSKVIETFFVLTNAWQASRLRSILNASFIFIFLLISQNPFSKVE